MREHTSIAVPALLRKRADVAACALRGAAAVANALSLVLLAALLLSPTPAAACSSCLSGGAASRWAYYGTTILLMLLPFAIAALALRWLRRAAREQTPHRTNKSVPSPH